MSKVPWAISETDNIFVKSDSAAIPILPKRSLYSIIVTKDELC